jgi:hypothetical protein
MRRILFVIALSALLMSGCGGATRNLQMGIDRYERTDYSGAMSQWSMLTTSERSLNQRGLVRYLVYRGLTHYRLGDRSSALSYLARGKDALGRGSASWVRSDLVAEMDRALADLNGEPDAAPPADPAPPAVAPPPPIAGEALVPIKPRPAVDPPPAKTEPANAGPAPTKTEPSNAGPAPAKVTASTAGPAPAKVTASTAGPARVKTTSPPTRTSPAVQSTSPK